MWYNHPSAIRVINEAKREHARSRSPRGLRLVTSDGEGK